jgi:hypothetical protein
MRAASDDQAPAIPAVFRPQSVEHAFGPDRPRQGLRKGVRLQAYRSFVQHLASMTGREPRDFDAQVLEDGSIRVSGPAAAAWYPPTGWTSRFARHLHAGFFDQPVPRDRAEIVPAA